MLQRRVLCTVQTYTELITNFVDKLWEQIPFDDGSCKENTRLVIFGF